MLPKSPHIRTFTFLTSAYFHLLFAWINNQGNKTFFRLLWVNILLEPEVV